MAKVLVLFYSRTGNTAALADAIADGARAVRFSEVDVRRLDDLAPAAELDASADGRERRERLAQRYRTLGDAAAVADYDALILGGPTRHGVMAAELARFLDQLGATRATGTLVDKVGAAFTPSPTAPGGDALTLTSLMAAMGSLGMLLVPPGPAATTDPGAPTDADLAAARRLGTRVATVAGWVRHAKGHEESGGGGHHHHH